LPVATDINDTSGAGGQFTTIVVDTGGKFATGVVEFSGASILANISANFFLKIEMTLILFSEAWGKLIHET
jgi:hypothetical protein